MKGKRGKESEEQAEVEPQDALFSRASQKGVAAGLSARTKKDLLYKLERSTS